MKNDIHPQYYTNAKITCSCGTVFVTGATKETLSVETCAYCHPAYTGKKKIVDSTGRVDRFKKLTQKAQKAQASRKTVKSKEQKRKEKIEKQQKAVA